MSERMRKLKQILSDDSILRPSPETLNLKYFSSLNFLIDDMVREVDNASKMLSHQLSVNPQSAVALYLLTMLSLHSETDFKPYAEKFISLYTEIGKVGHVIFLAKEILKHQNESSFALRTLATYLDAENHREEVLDVYNRIIKKDTTDYEFCMRMAKIKEKAKKSEAAIDYYKMAFHRALETGEMEQALEFWKDLIRLSPDDFEFYLLNGRKIAANLPREKAGSVWKALFQRMQEASNRNVDACITVLKEIISIHPDFSASYGGIILDLYMEKHRSHPHFQKIAKFAKLASPWSNLLSGLEQLENMVKFYPGHFVYHKSFGYGQVHDILLPVAPQEEILNEVRLVIDFKNRSRHQMTLRIALNSLKHCPPNDLLALSLFDRSRIPALIEGPPETLIEAVLQTLGKPASVVEIKNLLSPDFISPQDWPRKWAVLHKILKKGSQFDFKNRMYRLRPSATHEKKDLIKQFHSTEKILNKLKICEVYLLNHGAKDTRFREMREQIKKWPKDKKEKLIALVYLRYFRHCGDTEIKVSFKEEFQSAFETPYAEEIHHALPTRVLRNTWIDMIIEGLPDSYENILVTLFLSPDLSSRSRLLKQLFKQKKIAHLNRLIEEIFKQSRERPDHFLTLVKHLFKHEDLPLNYDRGRLFNDLTELLEKRYKDGTFSKGNIKAKKHYQQISAFLFKESRLFDYLRSNESSSYKKAILDQLDRFHFLENYLKIEIKEIAIKVLNQTKEGRR